MNDDVRIFSKDGGHLNFIEVNGKEVKLDNLPLYKKYLIKLIAFIFGGLVIFASFLGFFISMPFIGLLLLLTIKERRVLEGFK
jgi:hypothetical protein